MSGHYRKCNVPDCDTLTKRKVCTRHRRPRQGDGGAQKSDASRRTPLPGIQNHTQGEFSKCLDAPQHR